MKINNTIIIKLFFSILVLAFVACSDSSDHIEEVKIDPENNEECTTSNLYIEKDGFVRIEAESVISKSDWEVESTIADFEGDGYLIWSKEDSFSTPGIGAIKYSIKITNPGTYQFVWKSRIGQGTKNTDFNDSWLRIATAADFYGEKQSTGERVYPGGTGKTPTPEGTSKDGWFKVYMNKVGEWFWRSSTNDKDPFDVFVKFDKIGTYDIEISGRSKYHAIDQFVLFKTVENLDKAIAVPLSEIMCK